MIVATPLHGVVLAAVHAAAFPPGEQWGADAFATLLQTPGALGLLDEQGGLILTRQAGGEAELLTIAVIPQLRRRGIARGLLASALERCDGPMFLEVASDNTQAAALYASFGFVPCGRRPNYYGPSRDALILRR